MLHSAWQLLVGMLRLRFLWIGVAVLVPLALYGGLLRERLPADVGKAVPSQVSSLALVLLMALLAVAACLSFHRSRLAGEAVRARLEEKISHLESMLAKRERRRQRVERLAAIARTGRELRAARFISELDWQAWSESYEGWLAGAGEQIEGYFTAEDLARFRDVTDIKAADVSGAYSPAHNACLLALDRYLANLDRLLDRYDD